jgi:hypothetical protein
MWSLQAFELVFKGPFHLLSWQELSWQRKDASVLKVPLEHVTIDPVLEAYQLFCVSICCLIILLETYCLRQADRLVLLCIGMSCQYLPFLSTSKSYIHVTPVEGLWKTINST